RGGRDEAPAVADREALVGEAQDEAGGGRRGEGADGDAGAAGRVAVVVVHPGGAEEADGLRLGTGGGARGVGGAARGSVRLVLCCAHVSIVTRPPRHPGAPLPAGAVGPCPAASAEGCA